MNSSKIAVLGFLSASLATAAIGQQHETMWFSHASDAPLSTSLDRGVLEIHQLAPAEGGLRSGHRVLRERVGSTRDTILSLATHSLDPRFSLVAAIVGDGATSSVHSILVEHVSPSQASVAGTAQIRRVNYTKPWTDSAKPPHATHADVFHGATAIDWDATSRTATLALETGGIHSTCGTVDGDVTRCWGGVIECSIGFDADAHARNAVRPLRMALDGEWICAGSDVQTVFAGNAPTLAVRQRSRPQAASPLAIVRRGASGAWSTLPAPPVPVLSDYTVAGGPGDRLVVSTLESVLDELHLLHQVFDASASTWRAEDKIRVIRHDAADGKIELSVEPRRLRATAWYRDSDGLRTRRTR